MKLIDLTHLISEEVLPYPGTEPALLAEANTLEKDGFRETSIRMYSHTGTHMDAPAHMLRSGEYLDSMDISRFCGRAYVMDCTRYGEGGLIGDDELRNDARLEGAEYLILSTGWEKHWNTPKYFGRFPVLTEKAAMYLSSLGIKGIGVDAMSLDTMDSTAFPVHHIIFERGMLVVENLCNLAGIRGKNVSFFALPLKFKDSDGAPVRAFCYFE